MHQEISSLKWKSFIPNLSSSLSNLFTKNSFSDLTLVSDDKIEFHAHKSVLSASSPVLKNILLDNPHSHPLIYLRGVKQQELESILQFIYLGEASLYHSNINSFILTAKDLQIKQLAETVSRVFYNVDLSNKTMHVSSEEDAEDENQRRSISSIADEIMTLDIPADSPGDDEQGSYMQLYKCEECEATYKSNKNLLRHTRRKHESNVYSCEQCNYKSTQKNSLKIHRQALHTKSIHEVVKYYCDQCDYQTTRQGHLNRHQQGVHEGLKYSCNQCEYQATTQSSLKIHQQALHEGVRYNCNQCDYQTAWKTHFKAHTHKHI